MSQQQELADAFRRVLARYRSIHNLHRQTGVSQESLRRMEAGRSPRVDIMEGFARAIGEDVNHWRELAGYERVSPGPPALTYHPEFAAAEAEWFGGLEGLPPEAVEQVRSEWIKLVRDQRAKYGLETR